MVGAMQRIRPTSGFSAGVARGDRPVGKRAAGIAAGLLIAGALFGPLAWGSTQPWSVCILQALAGGASIAWLFISERRNRLLVLPVALAGVALLQVAPLPDGLAGRLSPPASQAYGGASLAVGHPVSPRLSLTPGETFSAAGQWFLLALVGAVAADVAVEPRWRRRLCWSIAIVGVVVLVLGLATWPWRDGTFLGLHAMRGPIKSYKSPLLDAVHSSGFGYPDVVRVGTVSYVINSWVVGDTFGPYVVSNHFAGCLELTIPLAVALLLGGRPSTGFGQRLGMIAVWTLILGALLAVSAGARCWAGTAALLVGLLAVGWGATQPGRARNAWAAAFVAILVGGAVAMVLLSWHGDASGRAAADPSSGGAAAVCEMLAQKVRGRGAVSEAAVAMFRQSPWLGSGLGSFREVCPQFRHGNSVMGFAHNDYVQFAAEMGCAGLVLFGAAAFWMFGRVVRRWGVLVSRTPRNAGIGVIGALVGFAVHGVFDWNLHVPANAWLCAILCGLLVGATRNAPGRPPLSSEAGLKQKSPSGGWSIVGGLLVVAGVGLAMNVAVREAIADRSLSPLRQALALQRQPQSERTDSERLFALRAALPEALQGFQCWPYNANGADVVAAAYLHLSAGKPSPDLSLADEWYCRVLSLCPMRSGVQNTLTEIHRAQTTSVPPPDSCSSSLP